MYNPYSLVSSPRKYKDSFEKIANEWKSGEWTKYVNRIPKSALFVKFAQGDQQAQGGGGGAQAGGGGNQGGAQAGGGGNQGGAQAGGKGDQQKQEQGWWDWLTNREGIKNVPEDMQSIADWFSRHWGTVAVFGLPALLGWLAYKRYYGTKKPRRRSRLFEEEED